MKDQMKENAQTGASFADYYDQLWSTYEPDIQLRTKPGSFGEARVSFIIKCVESIRGNCQNLRILDLGCGDGWISYLLSPYGDVVGTDFAPTTLDTARQKYGESVTFHLADPNYSHLGIGEDTKFDIVVSSEVIEHVQNHDAFVKQIHNFLTIGGHCILTTPNANVWEAYKQHKTPQPIENWLSPQELEEVFTQNGFVIQKHSGWVNWSYPYNLISVILGKSKVRKLFRLVGLESLWGKILLPYGILQLLFTQKSEI